MDSCFALTGAYQHGIAAQSMKGGNPRILKNLYCRGECKHSFKRQLRKGIFPVHWLGGYANRFSMTWENEVQVPLTFFFFAWHWKTDLNFAFCFSFSPNFEKRIWTSSFIFPFRVTLKNGYKFRFSFTHYFENGFEFHFSFSHHFEKRIWISFLYGLLLKNRSEFCLSFLHVLKNGRITAVSLCTTSLVVERIRYSLNVCLGS